MPVTVSPITPSGLRGRARRGVHRLALPIPPAAATPARRPTAGSLPRRHGCDFNANPHHHLREVLDSFRLILVCFDSSRFAESGQHRRRWQQRWHRTTLVVRAPVRRSQRSQRRSARRRRRVSSHASPRPQLDCQGYLQRVDWVCFQGTACPICLCDVTTQAIRTTTYLISEFVPGSDIHQENPCLSDPIALTPRDCHVAPQVAMAVQANCGHWYCGGCIINYWRHDSRSGGNPTRMPELSENARNMRNFPPDSSGLLLKVPEPWYNQASCIAPAAAVVYP